MNSYLQTPAMLPEIINWLVKNYVEAGGAALGLIYIFLSIRQRIWTWPVGLLTSLLYCVVFFQSKFYADMALQVYYVGVSIYGWYHWLRGNTGNPGKLPVTATPRRYWIPLLVISLLLFLLISFVLKTFTDSPVPVGDGFTTAFSLTATWMLARKYLEHWLIWIVVDLLSAVLYATKDLWATVVLFAVYTGMAVAGYLEWKKELTNRTQPTYSTE